MSISKPSISRRSFFALSGGAAAAAVGSQFFTVFSESTEPGTLTIPPSFTLFYKPEKTGNIWDTWIYYHEGTFYLYYNPSPSHLKEFGGWNSVALATSRDGVHWQEHGTVIETEPDVTMLGAGAVWPAGDKFIMNFSELRGAMDGTGKQSIFFAESRDLIHWERLGSEYAFSKDERFYGPKSRWDNIWPIARPEGGYYGYWVASPKSSEIGIGFGESDDGVTWRALPPILLEGLPPWPAGSFSPEVASAYFWKGKYYVFLGLDDLQPFISEDGAEFRPGITAMVSDSAKGPFQPALKNRRVLVGTSSYFMRFATVGDDVLVNHHSWEVIPGKFWYDIDPELVYMAPLKRAQWDDEGTLRLMWWEQNNLAKGALLPVSLMNSASDSPLILLNTAFDPKETLILEGIMSLPDSNDTIATGLYLQGTENAAAGTAFLVRENGAVDYGSIKSDGTGFDKQGSVDRELPLQGSVSFRLVRKGRLTEFYLNDYLMQCYSLPEQSTGGLAFIGSAHHFENLKAWYCT